MNLDLREIRYPTPEVIGEIIEIEQEAFGDGGLVSPWLVAPVLRHGRVYVGVSDNLIVASVQFLRDFSHADTAYLFGLSVRRRWQNRGVASFLLQEGFRRLRREGINRIELTVDPANQPAYHLYVDKFGFRQFAYYPNEYGHGESRAVLALDLAVYFRGDKNE